MARIKYPTFRTASVLGGIGWLLVLFPRFFLNYDLIVSGELIRLLYRFFLTDSRMGSSGAVQVAFLGLQIGPLAAAAAFVPIYREAAGSLGTKARRVASSIAAAMLLMAAATGIWLFSGAGAIMNGGLLCSWALLFVIFALTRFPLRSSFTHAIAGLIAVEVSVLAALSLYSVCRHWIASGFEFGPLRLLVDAIEFAPWALMLLFLLTTRREGGAVRPMSW